MAGFKAHGVGASAAGALATYAAAHQGAVSPVLLPGVLLATVIGGFLPDVDSDTGKPVRILFSVLAVAGASAALLTTPDLRETAPIAGAWWLGIAIVIRYVACELFKHATVHRGAFHSLPATAIAGVATFLLFNYAGATLAAGIAFGGAVALGYLAHLVLDEFWSLVDLSGGTVRPKKSLGSACKLRGSNLWTTCILYATLLALAGQTWLVIEKGG